MTIQYVGGVTGGRAGATSTTTQSLSGTLTGGIATSPAAGDFVVAYCSFGRQSIGNGQQISGNNSGNYSTATSQLSNHVYDSSSQLNYQFMGATPDTSLTIPSSFSIENAQRWVVHVFRGVDSTTPFDVAAIPAQGISTGRPDPAAITPGTTGAWIVAFYASAAAAGTAYTAPTDFATDWLGGTQSDTTDCMQGGGYYTGWTSGSYNPAAITAGGTTNTDDSWTAMTLALRPMIHANTGALTGQVATVAGSAVYNAKHTNTGALTGQVATVAGSASTATTRASTGILSGTVAVIVGDAARYDLTVSFTEATIAQVAAAVWDKTLPLDAAPIINYGATTLSAAEIDTIVRATWSKTLP